MLPRNHVVVTKKSFALDQIEFRTVIKLLTKHGKTPDTIFAHMSTVYGDFCPDRDTISKWHALFQQGRESVEDDDYPSHR